MQMSQLTGWAATGQESTPRAAEEKPRTLDTGTQPLG